jgi:hypothetical protein
MRQTFIALFDWYARLFEARWARRLAGKSATGPCTWRVTYRTRSWADLWGRVREAVGRAYPQEDGFVTRAWDHENPAMGGVEVYRGLTSGLIVGGWVTGRGPSGEAEVRVGVGRTSRLAWWASLVTVLAACLLTAAAVVGLLLVPVVGQAPGAVVVFLAPAIFLLALFVAGVAARFSLDAAVTAVEHAAGKRLTDREFEAAVELVRGAIEQDPAAAVVRDGW